MICTYISAIDVVTIVIDAVHFDPCVEIDFTTGQFVGFQSEKSLKQAYNLKLATSTTSKTNSDQSVISESVKSHLAKTTTIALSFSAQIGTISKCPINRVDNCSETSSGTAKQLYEAESIALIGGQNVTAITFDCYPANIASTNESLMNCFSKHKRKSFKNQATIRSVLLISTNYN